MNLIIIFKMSKQATKYSKKWEQLPEFKDWLVSVESDESKAKCLWCQSEFSVAHGGKNDVTAHSKRKKHVEVLTAKIATQPVHKFFEKQTSGDLLMAAKEATFVYHMVQHNQSFRSMKCTSEIVRVVCDQMGFSCSETKASAIVSGIFEPMILAEIKSELDDTYFVSISTDASNHKDIKMFPVLIRFFSKTKGIKADH